MYLLNNYANEIRWTKRLEQRSLNVQNIPSNTRPIWEYLRNVYTSPIVHFINHTWIFLDFKNRYPESQSKSKFVNGWIQLLSYYQCMYKDSKHGIRHVLFQGIQMSYSLIVIGFRFPWHIYALSTKWNQFSLAIPYSGVSWMSLSMLIEIHEIGPNGIVEIIRKKSSLSWRPMFSLRTNTYLRYSRFQLDMQMVPLCAIFYLLQLLLEMDSIINPNCFISTKVISWRECPCSI